MAFNNKEYQKEYWLKNKERIKERKKEYNLKNKERLREVRKEYYLKNIEYHKEYYLKNKIKMNVYSKEYNLKNKEQLQDKYFKNAEYIKEQHKEYRRRPETKELKRNYSKNKYKTDINFRLSHLCRSRILKALKGNFKSASTMELIGCTVDELRSHLESLFEPWMTWENQGLGGWDIEHIKACFHFNMADPEQQRECCNWSNLQPMEHIQNIKKGKK